MIYLINTMKEILKLLILVSCIVSCASLPNIAPGYIEAFKLTGAFKELKQDLIVLNIANIAYISWIEFVVSNLSGHPCNKAQTVCGFPYPFLNEIPTSERLGLYFFATIFVFMFYFFIRKTILHLKNS